MKIKDIAKSAAQGLATHKMRSALTMLGIIIGIGSMVVVMSVGQSAEGLILGEISGFGANSVFIVPGRQPTGAADSGSSLLTDSITIRDIEDLEKKSNVPGAVGVYPVVFGPVVAAHESETISTLVMGSSPGITEAFKLTLAQGGMFEQEDIDGRTDAVVIGDKVREELFGIRNPVGEKVKIKERSFRIVGVLAKKGAGGFIDFDNSIIGPYTTVQQNILGIRHFHRVTVEAESTEAVPGVVADIEALLRNNHNINDPEKDDFFVETSESMAATIGTITGIMTVLLASVAGISLLVGGVGIMNIMYVSVTERTQEIGLRKALGATNKDVSGQFLLEAIGITVGGGLVGVIGGTVLTFLMTLAVQKFAGINFPFVFSVGGAVLGVSVSSAIGLLFGIFPARAAAKKSPIEALRYE